MNLLTLYDAGSVTRCHTLRTLHAQNLGHHSWGVALILCYICEPSVNLLKAALYHDLAESVTGDVPATAKWSFPNLSDVLDSLEEKFNQDHDLVVDLTPQEGALLKWADMLEFVMYTASEIKMGNQYMKTYHQKGIAHLEGRTAPTDAALQLFKEISK